MGLVVHDVLKQWWKCFVANGSPVFGSKAYKSVRKAFPVRKNMLQACDELHRTVPVRNPRVNADRLFGAFSIDDAIDSFKTLLQQTVTIATDLTNGITGQLQVEPEYRITIEVPPLIGILDLVFSIGDRVSIVEYKTGKPRPSHKAQLQYYALLYFIKNGISTPNLRLIYSQNGTESIPCPSPTDFASLKNQLKESICRLNNEGISSRPQAVPSLDGCEHCSVRQFCSDYWDSPHTVSLRMEGIGDSQNEDSRGDGPVFLDAQLQVPPSWTKGATVEVNSSGQRLLVTFPKRCLPPARMDVLAVRILKAAIKHTDKVAHLMITRASEVFWRSE